MQENQRFLRGIFDSSERKPQDWLSPSSPGVL
jgi:hypothetical protein